MSIAFETRLVNALTCYAISNLRTYVFDWTDVEEMCTASWPIHCQQNSLLAKFIQLIKLHSFNLPLLVYFNLGCSNSNAIYLCSYQWLAIFSCQSLRVSPIDEFLAIHWSNPNWTMNVLCTSLYCNGSTYFTLKSSLLYCTVLYCDTLQYYT